MKKELSNITLIGIDCVDLKRLQLAADISTKDISFGKVKLLTSIKSDDPRVIQIPHINSTKKYPIKIGQVVVKVDPLYYRPTEVDLLVGDSSKAGIELGWSPKYNLREIVKEMIENDINLLSN